MAKLDQLQQLIKENPGILSFYPNSLLQLRSILSNWVENLKLDDILLSDESCKELFEEAISKLQDTVKGIDGIGLQFLIKNTVSELKKAYESDPNKFVEDLREALEKEEQLLASEVFIEMDVDGTTGVTMCLDDLRLYLKMCISNKDKVIHIVNTAVDVLTNWPTDIETKSTTPRDVFNNGSLIKPAFEIFQKLRKGLETSIPKLLESLSRAVTALQWHIRQWKLSQMYHCVSRQPASGPVTDPEAVEQLCEMVCECVSHLHRCALSTELQRVDSVRDQYPGQGIATVSFTAWFVPKLKQLLTTIFENFLVVIYQPPVTMMIEKEKGTKDKTDDTNSSKKFETTVGILGGNGFKDLGLQIVEVEIYLANNHDLANALAENRRPREAFQILSDRPARRTQSRIDSPVLPYQRTYKNLRVEAFRRTESKNVYKQLYHVVYDVHFQIPLPGCEEFTSQTYSLPIIVRTGAVQASEHVGVLLWHSFSSPNMYNLNAEVASSMSIDHVIQMINERVLGIGGRGLQPYEIQFFQWRIKMALNVKGERNANNESISLDAFIKDKVLLISHRSATEKDTMPFSLWRWIHAIINLLEDTLKLPWIDGIIYGFASRDQCIQALQNEPDGTFLLRFSESFLSGNYINSKGGLAVVVKTGGKVEFPPPLCHEDIEKEGLAKVFRNIGEGGQGQCLCLYESQLDLEILENRYPSSSPDNQGVQSNRYMGWSKKEVIVPATTDPFAVNVGSPYSMGACASASAQPEPARKTPKNAKRRASKHKSAETAEMVAANLKQYRCSDPRSPAESTTSSVASPLSMPMSPTNGHFHPVAIQFQRQQSSSSLGSPPTPTNNIPLPVFSQLNLNGSVSGGFGQPEYELELSPGQYFFVNGLEAQESLGDPSVVNLSSLGTSGIILASNDSAQIVSPNALGTHPPNSNTPTNFLLNESLILTNSQVSLALDNSHDPITIEDLREFERSLQENMQ